MAALLRQDGIVAAGAPFVVGAGWCVVLGLIIAKPLFVTHDSVSNYAHVWYVQDRIWHHHDLPFAMPVIGHGDALAFPYAFIPWMLSALLWPLLGSWAVTLALVVGAVGLIAGTYWSFPELRRGWWAAAMLINPALVAAPISGQLPFLWASAMLMAAVGAWRRRRHAAAAVLVGLAQATHAALLVPLTLLLVAWWWRRERDRRGLGLCYAASLVVAIPAMAMVFASPVVGDTPLVSALANLVGTLASRGLVLVIPIAALAACSRARANHLGWAAGAWFGAVLALGVALMVPLHIPDAIAALDRKPNTDLLRFIDSRAFVPGATYRILRARDGRIGMYELLLHGARLDSEFFPEDMARRSWPSLRSYSAFLRARRVDIVIDYDNYDRERRTNEHELLRLLAGRGDGCHPGLVGVEVIEARAGYDVYRIRRRC